MVTVLLTAALAVMEACSPGEGASNEGAGGSASGGTTAARGGAGEATGGTASGGDTTGGTGGSGGMPEQAGGHSGAAGVATGGHPSGGMGGSVSAGGSGGVVGGAGGTGVGGAGGTAGGGMAGGGAGGGVAYAPCPTNGNACKILPFGDSITEGVKSSDDGGYRSQLFKLILAAKQKVTFTGSLANGPTQVSGQPFPRMHEGHPGWTIEPGFSAAYGGISSLVPSPALDGKPNIILLHIGANDLFTRDTAGMATRLDALVDKIAQNAPSALIVLAQITPVGTTNNGHTKAEVDAANAAQMAYNSKIPAIVQSHLAKGQHITGVDMSKMPLTDLTTASVHPNDQGYAYMAGIWYAGIKDLLP
jgi:lysophospholipase L1-like esterase